MDFALKGMEEKGEDQYVVAVVRVGLFASLTLSPCR
jgi:hypothetical protein